MFSNFRNHLGGCNPLDDVYDGLDTSADPIVGNETYTLTSDDYADLGLDFGSFNSVEDAKAALPDFLSDKYPFYGQGSSVLVGYQLYIGNAPGISEYTNSDIYQLSNADYASTGSDAFGFYPNVNATAQIPDVLASQIATPTEGQLVLAKYKQYLENPIVGLADLVSYNFAGSFEGWTIYEESGADDVWTSNSGYVQGNGYFGDQYSNEEWLVSPSIDLSGESDLKFQITQELDFAGDASLVKILVSTDFTGDVLTATWNEIVLANPASQDMTTSEDYDFSAYDGETINLAFKYESIGDDPSTVGVDEGDASRWRISSLAIKTLGATGNTNSKGEYFMYSGGSWEAVDGVYYLSSEDYDSMGTGSGQPGAFNNFGSSIPPNNYLPTFLDLTFPYAQQEEELIVIYDYFSSSTGAQRRGNLYTFMDGSFVAYESTISTTLQFGFDNGVWVPDNTITIHVGDADYDAHSISFEVMPIQQPLVAWPIMEILTEEQEMLLNGQTQWSWKPSMSFLDMIAPNAAEEQKYVVTIDVYNGANTTEDFAVIKMGGEWVYQN